MTPKQCYYSDQNGAITLTPQQCYYSGFQMVLTNSDPQNG